MDLNLILLSTLIFLLLVVLILQIVLRPRSAAMTRLTKQVAGGLEMLEKAHARTNEALRMEFGDARREAESRASLGRTEAGEANQRLVDSLSGQLNTLQSWQNQYLQSIVQYLGDAHEQLRGSIDDGSRTLKTDTAARLDGARDEAGKAALLLRQEMGEKLQGAHTATFNTLTAMSKQQEERLESFNGRLDSLTESNQTKLNEIRQMVEKKLGELREANERQLDSSARSQGERLLAMGDMLSKLTASNETKIEHVRATVETKLSELRDDNGKRLEQMRLTVDEKLQGTLEQRLGDAFKLVSERLDLVHRGLGEMQVLAAGVGDLKKVLTNVKTRGGWGEVQLGALLDQMLTQGQFERNVKTKSGSGETVEYAIKLPGRGDEPDSHIWLPVDSKFPIEDYQRLVQAQEGSDLAGMEAAIKALRARVIQSAKDLSSKYLNPPETTDFGIMFIPTEGLYAEIIRQHGIIEELQNKYRVVVTGPTTFAALLNSLQMGFRTLTIQKQSSEVWKVLSQVKTEFGKFGESLEAVKKKIDEASKKMDEVGVRTRAVDRKLRDVANSPELSDAAGGGLVDLVVVAKPEVIEEAPTPSELSGGG